MRGHVVRRRKRYYAVVELPIGADGRRRQKWLSGFATRREAEVALAATTTEIHAGRYVEPSTMTLRAYLVEEWLPANASRVRATTLESYTQLLTTHAIPRIGHTALRDVSPVQLTKLYAALLDSGRADGRGGLSARTVRYLHTVLHKALSDAVRWRYLQLNPADAAQPPSASAARAPEMRTWRLEELQQFLRHTANHPLHIGFLLAAVCGLRRGELCGLRWADVELDETRGDPHLRIRQQLVQVGKEIRVSEPKTRAGRRAVALDAGTASTLRRLALRQREQRLALGEAYHDSGYVLAWPDGSAVLPDSLSQAFRASVQTASLPRIRLHDLRHTQATLSLQAGIHPKIVSERLGHASTAFTLDTYSHAVPSLQAQAAAILGDLIGTGEVAAS